MIFVAEIEGKAIAAFGSVAMIDAEVFFGSGPFHSDLMVLETDDGRPLWDGKSEIFVREADGWDRKLS
jgi:hypothetical protein